MTDILIRSMKMPHGCDSCKLNANGRGCSITGTKYESDTMVLMDFDEHTQRLKDCPIIELPEHGELIDRDAFDADARKRYCSACDNYNGTKCRACWVDDMLGDVADFETVIPSNKEV